ncbi:protein transport protein sft2 [Rhizophlyctis rosea]|nr:protein transport protein sft2 [Rhizophlyctis rosea]
MSNAERNFKDSLRAFNKTAGSGLGAPGGAASSSSSGGFGSFFTRGSTTSAAAAPAEDTESLLGSFRTRTQDAFSSMGLGNRQQQQQEENFCGLTRWQRFIGFLGCLGLAGICFVIAFFIGLPMLALAPRKFATAFTMGSLLAMTSFAILKGPIAHIRHMCSVERLPFSLSYVGSMVLTLYFALGLKSYILTIICSIIQIIALVWYFGSYVPGGTAGLSVRRRDTATMRLL